ncbi:MAG: DegV family protein [Erysipelotrichaceae bacterium]|nr:DegV family protein [Erysipelotrichaceae bacterium]
MKVAIMTDTNSGMSVEDGKKLGVYVLAMPVIINGKDYHEHVDITHQELFRQLRSLADVSTSQPAPGEVMGMWESIFDDGYDEVVYIPMTSGLTSGTANAIALSDDYDGRVQVADNHRISVPLKESVIDAVNFAKQGYSAAEIKALLEQDAYNSSVYITVDTLEYLKKSHRITAAAAGVANALKIKPILQIQGEKLDAFSISRTKKQSEKIMIDAVTKDLKTRFADFPEDEIQIAMAGTLEKEEDIERWCKKVNSKFKKYKPYYEPLSCSIACHTGIDAFAIGIMHRTKRNEE